MKYKDNQFASRHLGPRGPDVTNMLSHLQVESLEALIDDCTPAVIRKSTNFEKRPALNESELLKKISELAKKNKVFRSYIGQGYYPNVCPTVIQRNILESPAWYTAYTPYQAEISQGRMEALLNFQTMVTDLTGMDVANASLLDEGTALAEAMFMAFQARKDKSKKKVFADANIFPQSLAVLKTRSEPLNIEVVVGDIETLKAESDFFAVCLQYPDAKGEIKDLRAKVSELKSLGASCIVCSDPLSLCLLTPPGEWGADIVIGSSQRFGVPLCFGGPHAAFLATKNEYVRLIPGRIIGLSKDSHGNAALRLTLQTREQHIRREKATSNICTAQVLLAVMASMYAVYHGPKGLKNIAEKVHAQTARLQKSLLSLGYKIINKNFFDTLCIELSPAELEQITRLAQTKKINFGVNQAKNLLLSLDETVSDADLLDLLNVFSEVKSKKALLVESAELAIPKALLRESKYLQHPTFNSYHSETEMLRYIYRLQEKDMTLCQAMIPLGSCTMKLNATSEMIPITWNEFANMHPFAPQDQTEGYRELIHSLERLLSELTGFAAVSVQPNAGSQGEYAGLLVIRKYLHYKGQKQRNVCLIPSSAHGTNPASAAMSGFNVVVVACDELGNVDLGSLKQNIEKHRDHLAALMITYPSTHGVFEESISEICELIHDAGGQVYMDGANFNALVGVAKPGNFGPDVCHLNLHKTFCIPHGGGGPGVGPIGVAEHLKEFLPGHTLVKGVGGSQSIGPVASAPYGSAGILPISWSYIMMMGFEGLKTATQVAILNANYIAKKLEPHFRVLYRGKSGWVAHECIIDVRDLKKTANVSVDDIAKRLMDYGFHAPTMSWPVAGTLMIEPTESESKQEIDRFCEAMIHIRQEISEIESGKFSKEDNVLVNAPHSFDHLVGDDWKHSYSREKACYPLSWVKTRKFKVPVSRVDNAYGDRNLVCTCPPVESYQA